MTFEGKLLCFWAVIGVLAVYLRQRPASSVARAAMSWIGPYPVAGEPWARFQWRWALYSFSWLLQLLFAMSAVFLFFMQEAGAYERHTWLQVVWFALPLAAGIALLAFLGFLCRAAKAKAIGPNPEFVPEVQLGAQRDVPASGGSAR